MKDLFDNDGATFDSTRQYRYCLWRKWDINLPFIMFIGLNPSTANEHSDDPTIRRVMRFARDWGYGGVFMLNLFAYVTTNPKQLLTCTDAIGPENDMYLFGVSKRCNRIIFAWGAFKETKERAKDIMLLFPNAEALVINKDGTPRHPLYVPGDVIPVPFTQ